MAKTFRTSGAGSQQTLHEIEDEKIPVYDTTADAEADLANLAEEQIVATKDAGGDEQTLIEYVDGRLETTTTEITMDVFKTGSKAQLNKSGNNVQFHYAVFDNTTFNPITESVWTTIGTLPVGFRPKQQIHIAGQGTETNGATPYMIGLEPTGEVQIWKYPNIAFGNTFAIDIDYNVDGTNSHGMTVNTLKDAKDYTDAQVAEKVSERNFTSTVATSTMDYKTAVKAILDSIDFSTWENKTYAGIFISNGQAPHQWVGTYQLSKVSNLNYGYTIMGEANTRQFTGIWANATDGWVVHVICPIEETAPALVTLDGNACVQASLVGVPDNAQILSVKGWSEDSQGQRISDWLCIPATNGWGIWYIHVEGWNGTPIPNYQVYIQVKYRMVS